MNGNGRREYVVDLLFVLALFLLFAVSSILLIAVGASIYRKNTDSMAGNYTIRSSHAYITEKVRSADTSESVSIGELDGVPALLLRQEINDTPYTTYLYLHEGYLTELFCKTEISLPPSAGMQLIELEDMRFSPVSDRAIRVDLTETDGTQHFVVVALRASSVKPDDDDD